ncbi:MAG: thioether cross-link-forming SCIFF peptide maturase [Candidatus Improbicoccus pseudotrichonymphae]|uniref:Thioether cross-link-forming SCIFF peptide maturase n=1 Tax=Candidatus Improbicoccus pseudotrichonymphae TaxID=3033792 RepID=A0AA48KVJ1_9FIRM|nr:MAG: thioether cross-link-forming SCIFF peptide maturase [Candidatus Improbicoccus pseudotrichonymphae]
MIHKYRLNGFNIVLDINSSSIHVVSDAAYDFLDFLDAKGRLNREYLLSNRVCELKEVADISYVEEFEIIIKEIRKLISENKLFSGNINVGGFDTTSKLKSMCLNISHSCNLSCKYCFAQQGTFGGKNCLMSLDIAKKSVDFLFKSNSYGENVEIDFFGGEPLMNFDVLKKVVFYAKNKAKMLNKKIKFTITTNGVLLNNEIIEFINKHIDNVVLSLDGRKKVHDFMRGSSFDLIVPKFKKLVDMRDGKNYYIRGTFTRKNLDFLRDILEIYKLGFKRMSLEPVVLPSNIMYSINEDDLEKIIKEYESVSQKIIEIKEKDDFVFFHFELNIDKSPCFLKRIKGCGCGVEYVAVTPSGDVYPCHQFVGIDKFKIENINNTQELEKKIKKMYNFRRYRILTVTECISCWAKYFCSGGCPANNWNFNKDLDLSYKISCKLIKKRLECAMMIQAALRMKKVKTRNFVLNKKFC